MVAPMPVAKLSREFYDRFGDKLTDELVNCLNSIEASYRAEIKDLFAAHFGRFEEKLERYAAETAAQLARFEKRFEHRLAETATDFARFEADTATRFAGFEEKFEHRLAETATGFARLEADTATHFAGFEERFEHRLAATKAELQVEIHSVKADLIKWTFVFWAPVALAVIGLYFKT